MAVVNRNEQGTKVTEMSIVSISVFAAICLGLMAALVTRPDFEIGLNTYSVASGALLLGILFFIFGNDFSLLTIFYSEKRFFGIAGTGLYGLGEASMIVGISLALKALAACLIGCLFLSVFTLGFLAYNAIRLWQVGLESPVVPRITLRVLNFLILVIGYVIIWKI